MKKQDLHTKKYNSSDPVDGIAADEVTGEKKRYHR